MYRILFVVSLVLKIFMFRDAVRRGVPTVWLWIIALAPLGEVLYFFVHPWEDLRLRQKLFGRPGRRRPRAEPPVDGELALAKQLYEDGRFAEAAAALEALLQTSPSHKEALYLLGTARLQLHDYDGATVPLARLRDIRAGHRDYAAWLQLAYAHYEAGRPDEAIAELEGLAARTARPEHRVVLAEYLLKAGYHERARDVLRTYRRKPADDEDWRRRVRRLSAALEES